jgi:hypothetical protein
MKYSSGTKKFTRKELPPIRVNEMTHKSPRSRKKGGEGHHALLGSNHYMHNKEG